MSAVVLVGGLAAAWFFVAPSLIRARAKASLSRFGDVEIGDASLGVFGVELLDVSFEQKGMSASAHRVFLDTGAFGWLRGNRSLRAIHADGFAIDADLEQLDELQKRARAFGVARGASTPSASRDENAIAFRLTNGSVALRVGNTESLHLRDVRVVGTSRQSNVSIGVARTNGTVTCTARNVTITLVNRQPTRVFAAAVEVEADDIAGLSGNQGGSLLSRLRVWRAAIRRLSGSPTVTEPAAATLDRELAINSFKVRTGTDDWIDSLEFRATGHAGRFSIFATGSARGGLVDVTLAFEPKRFIVNGNVALKSLPLALFAPFIEGVSFVQLSNARASAELRVEMRSDLQIDLEGELGVENAELRSPRLANQPIREVTFSLRGQATLRPLERRIEVSKSVLTIGSVTIPISARLELPANAFVLDARAVLPATPCDAAIHALPRDLLGDTSQFRFGGVMGGEIVANIDSRNYDATIFRVRVEDGCDFRGAPAMAALTRFDGPFVHEAIEPDGSRVVLETGPGSAEWTPITQVSPFFLHAVLAHEDAAFFRHSGFAPLEIQTALIRNLKAGRYVQGASTITMQLVKNVFLNREKTLSRKVQEALLTWWIERNMPKHRMLELYVNVIEYGPRIYGVRQASEYYFGRAPSELSAAESAFLACILPNPKAFHTLFEQGRITPTFAEKMRRLLVRMRERGRIDGVAFAEAMAQMATFRFHALGTESAEPRLLRGTAASLPLGGIGISYSSDGDNAEGIEEETSFDDEDWSQ